MTDWTYEGVADIGYTHAFHPEMAPAALRLGLTLEGLASPVGEGKAFRYAELGCGQGLTSNLLAALHPEGVFEAVDLLPEHIEGASALAADACLGNVRFVRASFTEWAKSPGEPFDVIALHGVWSWVSEADRACLRDILRDRLAPGGVAYLSYNCLPGWAADMPVRRLLRDHVAADDGPLVERVERAVDWLRCLARQGGYFDHVPAAATLAESLAGKAPSYVAHEYLNRDWACFWHADVAADMAAAGLVYGGSTSFFDALDGDLLAADARQLVDAESDPAGRRGLIDTLACRRFRRDLYVKAPRHLDAAERQAALAATRFALCLAEPAVPEGLSLPLGELDLPGEAMQSLLARLAVPRALGDLPADSLSAILALCGLGVVAPVAAPVDASGFNRAVLSRNRETAALRQLAAGALGTGIEVDLLDRLFLLAEAESHDPSALAWSVLAARGQRLRRDGEPLDGDAANLAELRRLHDRFVARRRSWLVSALSPAAG